MLLAELERSVQQIKRVGPATARAFARLGIFTERDLLLHLPRDYHDRTIARPIADAHDGRESNTVAEVIAHDSIGRGHKETLKVYVRDESATAALVCFGRAFLATRLRPGVRIRLGHLLLPFLRVAGEQLRLRGGGFSFNALRPGASGLSAE